MKEFHKKLNEIVENAKTVSLDANEKKKISDFLKSHMNENPILHIPEASKAQGSFFSKYFTKESFQNIFAGRLNFATVAFAALFLMGSSAYASQSSLPGDILYPAKILGERIKSSVAFSIQSKAALNAEYALERLKETEELKKADKLDPETKAELQISFLESSKYSLDYLDGIKDKDSEREKILTEFEAKLGEHKETIMKLAIDGAEVEQNIKFTSSVDLVLSRLTKGKNSVESKESGKEKNKEKETNSKEVPGTITETPETSISENSQTSGSSHEESSASVQINIPGLPTGSVVPGL